MRSHNLNYSKKYGRIGLWLHFVTRIFGVLCIGSFLSALFSFIMMSLGSFPSDESGWHVMIPLSMSLFLGTCMSFIASKNMARPMQRLNDATKQVATGDFSVQLPENRGPREIREIISNFNKMVKELDSIETLRNDFVQNVSHEFKTPLAAIEGYTTLLRSPDLTDEERDEYSSLILFSASNLSTLCGNVLQLSKLENQELVIETSAFRLDEQIRFVVLMLEPQWSNKKLDMDIELEQITYTWSDELLSQVWTNIISNAIKYTPSGGNISITLKDAGERIAVEVFDTGAGMSEDVQRHIFEKFYQGDKSRKTEGNGLGLTLVKRIVDLAGGEIEVKSRENHGTAFTVYLPNM